jgi:uncharacterized BrkB/YihY/UPF0761 family membrane protein
LPAVWTGEKVFHELRPRGLGVSLFFAQFQVSVSVLFAFILTVLPNVLLKWSDVIVGAVLTSLLFHLPEN